MAPRYSLLDDEDNLGSLLEPDTLQSLRPTSYEMSPSPQPQAATMPDLHKRDPEVEDAWRGLELQKIHEAQKPSYGLAEGARDVIPTGLALALDAALNHGRGAAGILQGGMGEVANQQALRDKERAAAGELAVKIHGKDDSLGWQRAMTAAQNAGTGLQRVNNTQQRWVEGADPNSEHSKGAVTIVGQKAGSSAEGRILKESELADVAAATKAKATEATTNAATDALAANPRALTTDQTADNTRADAALELQRQQLALTNEIRGDTRAEKLQQQKIRNGENFNKELGDAMTVAEKARQLQKLFEANPEDLPGVGMWDANKLDFFKSPEDASAQQLFAEFSNPQFRDIAGRAVTGKEQERVLNQVGNMKSTNENIVRQAVSEIANTMAGRIRSGSVGREELAREILRTRGLDDILGPAPEPAATAQPEQPSAAADPLADARELALPGEAVPADLGTTQGRVPKISAANNTVTVTLNGISRPYPREAALRMKQLDPRVELSE